MLIYGHLRIQPFNDIMQEGNLWDQNCHVNQMYLSLEQKTKQNQKLTLLLPNITLGGTIFGFIKNVKLAKGQAIARQVEWSNRTTSVTSNDP